MPPGMKGDQGPFPLLISILHNSLDFLGCICKKMGGEADGRVNLYKTRAENLLDSSKYSCDVCWWVILALPAPRAGSDRVETVLPGRASSTYIPKGIQKGEPSLGAPCLPGRYRYYAVKGVCAMIATRSEYRSKRLPL